MKRIAVLTSGGDAPGMNAAIRAVVRTGLAAGLEVYGVRNGYAGLINGEMERMTARDVGGIIQQAGTMLRSARSREFREEEGRRKAIRKLAERGIDGLVVIGGNGTQTGNYELSKMGFPVVGVASTIDNDLYGTDMSIGVDTALNTVLEAIDRIKATASSHTRAFLVEVMGRDSGYLALTAGITGGAEAVIIPEVEVDPDSVARELLDAYARGKSHAILVVAEGAKLNAASLVKYFQENHAKIGFELRVTVLGHVQRGGTPTAFDRMLGTRLGAAAVDALLAGEHGVLVGWVNNRPQLTPLSEVAGRTRRADPQLYELARVLAR
ncbi:MAG: 6-phosphofructokinase [Firmicutes bacterium]|nr:6-phosphofructokinase [Bacillota bacterium]